MGSASIGDFGLSLPSDFGLSVPSHKHALNPRTQCLRFRRQASERLRGFRVEFMVYSV